MKKNYLNFSIIISNTSRSIEYLRQLRNNNLIPNNLIHLDNRKKKYVNYYKKFSLKYKINYKNFLSETIDKSDVTKNLLNLNDKILVYSGYPGKIIKNPLILKKKNLLHSHPGKLPNYKGSTTIFYSLILEKKIYCSTIVLSSFLDEGDIILQKQYTLPKKLSQINGSFDDKIRAQNMILSLKKLQKNNIKKLKKKINKKKFIDYTVAHTLIRSISFKQKKI